MTAILPELTHEKEFFEKQVSSSIGSDSRVLCSSFAKQLSVQFEILPAKATAAARV